MKKTRKYLAIVPALIVFLLVFYEPLYSLDAMIGDKVYSQMSGTGDTIKIIGIDEETLKEYGDFSSWSREKSAKLIEVLNEKKEAKPKVLAFDIMFVGDSNKVSDDALAKQAEKTDNIVVATNLVYRGATKYFSDGSAYYDKWNIESEERPFDSLNKNVSSGYANVALSRDGFVRTTKLSVDFEGEKRYSFATQIYMEYMKSIGKDAVLPEQNESNEIRFFYSGMPGDMTYYSMRDVLNGKIPAETFKDSIVIVGAFAPGFKDSYHSAAKRSSDMYGAEINANIVNALMTGKTATTVNPLYVAIIAALIILIYTFFAREMKMYAALIIALWIIIVEGIVGRIMATHGSIISLIYLPIVLAATVAWIIIEKYVLESIRKRKVLTSFGKYMAPQVIANMAKNGDFDIELGGQRRDVAVLFVDIRGFTTMSESMEPEEVVNILNQYLSLTTASIFSQDGMLDKFVGDATMAVFNAPNDQEDYVYKAVLAAIDMREQGKKLSEKLLKDYGKEVGFGIGINVGDAVVGNIGCDTRMDYTAIGDTVNTAARLESRAAKGEILISEATLNAIKDRVEVVFKEEMELKGKTQTVKVYNVIDVK